MFITDSEFARVKQEMAENVDAVYEGIRNGKYIDPVKYNALVEVTRDKRIDWWRQARFGIFIHYGIYSARGNGEWELAWDAPNPEDYEKSVSELTYQKGNAEKWVQTAKAAGAKYIVLTTRHHDGFSLWDSKVNPYNSVNYGPKTDIVREFVDACRKEDMRIGFYSSVMDWRYPGAGDILTDPEAKTRFLEYIYQLNRELLTNYGKIDILWYDMPYPLDVHQGWNTELLNQRLRALQPDIIINERGGYGLKEDFANPEEHFAPNNDDWETCLTFNQISWGYLDEASEVNYQYSAQQIVKMLLFCARNCGNLLLNIGPDADGNIPASVSEKLERLGCWLRENGEAVYGHMRRFGGKLPDGLVHFGEYGGNMISFVSAKDKRVYICEPVWTKRGEIIIAGYDAAPKRVYYLKDKTEIDFVFDRHRIILKNLPAESPDKILGITTIVLEFEELPRYRFCGAYPHLNEGNRAYTLK